jgi:hypothetical protein
MAGEKVKCGPPFSARKSWFSSLNATGLPEAREPASPWWVAVVIFEFLKMEV